MALHIHDSHSLVYRDPIGPVKAGGRLTLRFFSDDCARVTLRTWSGEEARVPMQPLGDGRFEATIRVPKEPMLFWYDFILHYDGGEGRYGNAYDQLGGVGADYDGQPHSFQVTVYDPKYQTPKSLRHAVIYQIFPDRFRKSGRITDKRRQLIAEAHPDATFHDNWEERPALDPDPANGDNRAHDFFGGTLRGIMEELDALKELGVDMLYLNPVFRSSTNHRYNTGDYLEVDPILGTNADFARLCEEAEKRGMRVLMDGVFSHTGSDSRYFNRDGRYDSVGAYQSKDSPYAGWYTFEAFPEKYDCWWGIYTLPAVRKENEEYREFLLGARRGVLPTWIKRGAAGWRLDVADELPMDLLQGMRQAVKRADEEAVLLGEVWEDASNKVAYGQTRCYCLGDTLDSVMNYPLRRAVIDFFTGACDAYALARLIRHQREVYPAPFYYGLMNLLGSHDRVRILNAMAGYDADGAVQPPREVTREIWLTEDQLASAKRKYAAAMKLLCALPGAPTVYYGDEIGMQGMADPWNRAPMDREHADYGLRSEIAALLNERRASKAMQTGYMDVEATDQDTLIVKRYAIKGKDAFGSALKEPEVQVEVTRKGL